LQKAKEALGKRLEKLEAKAVHQGEKLAELESRIDSVVAHVETVVPPAPPAPPARRSSFDLEKHRASATQELKDLRAELELEKLTREHTFTLQTIEEKNRSDTAISAALAEANLTKKDLDHAGTQSAQMKEQLAVLNAAAAAAAGPSKWSNDKKKKKKQDTKGKRQETSSDSSLGDSASDSDSSSSGEDTPPGSPPSKKRSKAGGSSKKGKKEKKNKKTRKKMKKQAFKSEENSSAPE
jgi:hypothetical protein